MSSVNVSERYINRQLIHSTIEDFGKKICISLDVVESALLRYVNISVNWSIYTNLETIVIDEIAVKKGHNDYLIIVSVKDKLGELSVIAVLPDKLKETVKIFLESIPSHLKKTVKSVCTDMYDGFVKSSEEVLGSRIVVIDRYVSVNFPALYDSGLSIQLCKFINKLLNIVLNSIIKFYQISEP